MPISVTWIQGDLFNCVKLCNRVQTNIFRKEGTHITRAVNAYVCNTVMVHLGIYSNSPYYKEVRLWNELSMDVKAIKDKQTFNYHRQRYFQVMVIN